MPEMIPLGWFHTIMGVIALVTGATILYAHREISLRTRSGQIYLLTTIITAATALAIYQRGVFGPAHVLAVAALGALGIGALAESLQLFGRWSRQVQAFCFSATLLCHFIPAVTDGLLRLPVGDPFLTSFEHPVMQMSHLALVVIFAIGVTMQLRWIGRQGALA